MDHLITYPRSGSLKDYKLFESTSGYPVIFLDIDGVLNLLHIDTGSDEYGQIFSEECVNAFRYLIDHTNAKIVISSTWKASGLSVMKEMWGKRNLPGEVIDITPNEVDIVERGVVEYYDEVDRGTEIDQWMKDNNFHGKYVILDDVPDFTREQQSHYVKTNPKIGLTMDDVKKSIDILR